VRCDGVVLRVLTGEVGVPICLCFGKPQRFKDCRSGIRSVAVFCGNVFRSGALGGGFAHGLGRGIGWYADNKLPGRGYGDGDCFGSLLDDRMDDDPSRHVWMRQKTYKGASQCPFITSGVVIPAG
jgi:hypothetical protein